MINSPNDMSDLKIDCKSLMVGRKTNDQEETIIELTPFEEKTLLRKFACRLWFNFTDLSRRKLLKARPFL